MTLHSKNEPVKRRYHAPRRQAQANETREAILEAAMDLFNVQGFSKTTMSQVAEKADVSEQTIYNVFGDKIGLLHAAGMHAMETGVGNPDADIIETLRAEPDPMERIRLAARATREIWEGGSFELEQMVFSPDVKDPRLLELADTALSHNLEVTRTIAELLFPDSIRRRGLDLDDIAVVFTAIDTAATVTKLIKLGWTLQDYEEWLVQFLTLFLDPDLVNDAAKGGSHNS